MTPSPLYLNLGHNFNSWDKAMGNWEMYTVQVHSCTVGRGVALQYITVSDREESEAASTRRRANEKGKQNLGAALSCLLSFFDAW